MTSARKLLLDRCLRPKKSLGQSFLRDIRTASRIVEQAGIDKADTVVEIGAGLGILTREIAKKAGEVVAVEIDAQLAEILRSETADLANVTVVRQDVLTYDFSLPGGRTGEKKTKVLGNIPYYIASPILFRLMSFRRLLASATLMVQKEMARRITAVPGSKEYGIPSVMSAAFAPASILFYVSSSCFYPRPKVESAVIRLEFPVNLPFDITEESLFVGLVRTAFAQRRKTLWNNLRSFPWGPMDDETWLRIMEDENIDPRQRAESLTPAQFAALSNALLVKLPHVAPER